MRVRAAVERAVERHKLHVEFGFRLVRVGLHERHRNLVQARRRAEFRANLQRILLRAPLHLRDFDDLERSQSLNVRAGELLHVVVGRDAGRGLVAAHEERDLHRLLAGRLRVHLGAHGEVADAVVRHFHRCVNRAGGDRIVFPHGNDAPVVLRGHLRTGRFGEPCALPPRGDRWRDWRNRTRHDRFGRREVALQQHRREREHVADVIEPVAHVVRREVLRRVEVDPDEVANGVVVLVAVEPPHRHPAGVGLGGAVVRLEYVAY